MQQEAHGKIRRIGVCADDFGMSPGVNLAVQQLARQRRISALSCLVDGPAAREGASTVRSERLDADVGLHLNLTDAFPEAPFHLPLSQLIARCYARAIRPQVIREEVRRQLDRFEDLFGFPPDHVDGHLHVHQLPLVRTELLGELASRYPGRLPWLRSGRAGTSRTVKPAVIGALGAGAFTRQAHRKGFGTNRYLLGVYAFNDKTEYLRRLESWFAQAGEDDLLMCHPASGFRGGEPHEMARHKEFQALTCPQYPNLLARSNLAVTRPSSLRSQPHGIVTGQNDGP